MNDFSRLLQNIKEHPVLYLGKPSITCLNFFVNGYLSTLSDLGFTDEGLAMEGFQEWIQEREKTTVTQSWSEIIIFNNGSDRSSFYKFFELFEQFLKQKESLELDKNKAKVNLKPNHLHNWKSGTYNPYRLFNEIKKRPGMFLGTSSITRLDMVLRGYTLARREVGLDPTEEELEFEGFEAWIQGKYEIKLNQSWSKIILFYSIDEHEALKRFFELYEEYKNHYQSLAMT
jgi:hypothetical protein